MIESHFDSWFTHFMHVFALMAGDVVELCGSEGSGKSELLLNVTAQCVLPKKNGGVLIGMNHVCWKGRQIIITV